MKESLRLHGQLTKDQQERLAQQAKNIGSNAYEDFVESNYRQNLRQAASFGDYNDRSSSSYSKTMRRIYERSQRHQDAQDLNHLYSNDVSALKKLKIAEKS